MYSSSGYCVVYYVRWEGSMLQLLLLLALGYDYDSGQNKSARKIFILVIEARQNIDDDAGRHRDASRTCIPGHV